MISFLIRTKAAFLSFVNRIGSNTQRPNANVPNIFQIQIT